ncbi:MAG: DUF4179 domain-containing protein [Desulfosporosinus sp.]|nr:DUF4179 domain-containing protein [Desulfosporosinus sp.]
MKNNFDRDELKSNLEIPSVVPESINARIDDTLRNLEQRKKSRNLPKKSLLLLVACISIMGLSTLAAFGQNLPIINSLLNFVNPSAAKNYETVKVDITGDTKKTVVNKKTTDKGITLTVNDLSYDGTTLIVGFDLSKPGGFGSAVTEIDTNLLPFFLSTKDGIPSKNLVNTGGDYLSQKDNGNYQGYASFYFGDSDLGIQDGYTLNLGISNIGLHGPSGFTELTGLWKIDTGLTEKDICTAAQTTESNVVHKIKNGEVDSVKIIRSALSNIISLKGINNTKQALKLGFFILDDKGNCLNYMPLTESEGINGDFKIGISLMRIPNDTKKITVIPYRFVNSKEKQYSADLTKLPVSIKIQDQEINISDIERNPGKLIMHYTISGLTDRSESTNFQFEDEVGNLIEPIAPRSRTSPMDYETHQGTYEFMTDHPEKISKVTSYGHEYELMNDYKFDVELK